MGEIADAGLTRTSYHFRVTSFPLQSVPVHPEKGPSSDERRAAALADPGFGRHFSDHVARARWTSDGGWDDTRIGRLADLAMHPASAVMHYGQSIFEGLKAYRHSDDSIWVFRPDRNAARFARSAERLALPVLPEELFVDSVVQLVAADAAWVPTPSGPDGEQSLYLRPVMYASEAFLGVRPAQEITYLAMASPAGAYFADGVHGVRLWVCRDWVRAAPGGTGAAKCGGNYAASLVAQEQARARGCDQVLWLDAQQRHIEESGTMNLCLVTADGELLTPASETILDGVTRDSLLTLAGEHGLTPVMRPVELAELTARILDGGITEAFACGTAAVITPVTALLDGDRDLVVADGRPGPATLALREHLLDLQFGRRPDQYGWLRQVG